MHSRRPRQPVRHRQRADLIHVRRYQRNGHRRQANANCASQHAQPQRLHQVDRENSPAGAAHALHHGDAFDLLADEHAGDARYGDASQDHNHQPDEAQIVLRATEVFTDLFLPVLIRPHAHELRPQRSVQTPGQRVHRRIRQSQKHLAHHAAAKAQQARGRQVREVDQHARSKAERAERAARLICNDSTNGKSGLADRDVVTHLQAKLREQLRPDQGAVMLQQRVRIRPAILERKIPIERKPGLDGAQLHHLRPLRRLVCRTCHRRHLDGVDSGGTGHAVHRTRDSILHARAPRAIG